MIRWCKRNPKIAIPSVAAGFFFIVTTLISTSAWRESSANAMIIAEERDNVKEERDESERQRVLANEAKLQAEKNQKIAEKQATLALQNIPLVATDVDTKLAKRSDTSDIRVGILQLMEKKWDELDKEMTGGISGEAIALFERSRVVRAEMVSNRQDQANRVNSMLSKARVGNVDAAQKLANELAKSDKKDPDLRLDIARALAQASKRLERDQKLWIETIG